ncbi:MAG: hypothetical protein JWQ49_652 [Edaphobacter sp.]|nr:hypothetical protein [Edaphobacter sp.]
MLDSSRVPGWIYHLVDKLTSCSAIEPLLFVLRKDLKVIGGSERGPVLYRSWVAFDRWIRQPRTDALRKRDCCSLLGSRSLSLVPLQTRGTTTLLDGDVARIKAGNLDLLLYLGRNIPGVELSACATLGALSVQNGTTAVPEQFWDMYEGNRVSLHGPQIVEQKQGRTRVIYRASTSTGVLSLALNQDAAYWDIARVLVTQLSGTERQRMEVPLCSEANAGEPEIHRTLGNMPMMRFLVQWTMRIVRNELMKRLFRDQWSIVLQTKGNLPKVIDQDFKIMRPPRDRFYADPFLIERNGRSYLFFEDYRFSSQKGLISCCELDSEGNYTEPRVVLERKYHLSYPFLFAWQGETYMIPETRHNGTIEVYRASDFPYSWVREAVLMSDVEATDSTLLQHQDKWWLFTAGVLDHAAPEKTLCLFFADSPWGPWSAHPKNPIVSDACHARPAGCLYFEDGRLIRPGQDCSKGYGYAVELHRVDVLSETDYRETLVASITPDRIPGSRGIHTVNQNAQYRVLDCKFLISRFGLSLFSASQRSKAEFSNSFAFESVKSSR